MIIKILNKGKDKEEVIGYSLSTKEKEWMHIQKELSLETYFNSLDEIISNYDAIVYDSFFCGFSLGYYLTDLMWEKFDKRFIELFSKFNNTNADIIEESDSITVPELNYKEINAMVKTMFNIIQSRKIDLLSSKIHIHNPLSINLVKALDAYNSSFDSLDVALQKRVPLLFPEEKEIVDNLYKIILKSTEKIREIYDEDIEKFKTDDYAVAYSLYLSLLGNRTAILTCDSHIMKILAEGYIMMNEYNEEDNLKITRTLLENKVATKLIFNKSSRFIEKTLDIKWRKQQYNKSGIKNNPEEITRYLSNIAYNMEKIKDDYNTTNYYKLREIHKLSRLIEAIDF